jgi:DNA-binding transcriptional ArsR family regulator
MGALMDLLQEVPLSAVLQERVKLADEKLARAIEENEDYKRKIAALVHEIEILRALIPAKSESALGDDTARVLVYIFKAAHQEERDVGAMARALKMERGVLQYHLDRLKEAGMAARTSGNYISGHIYWGLTPEGRRHAVENKLI